MYAVGRMADCVGHLRALTLIHVASPTAESKKPFREEIALREADFQQFLSAYAKRIDSAEDRDLFERIAPAFERYIGAVHRVVALSEELKRDEADQIYIATARPLVLDLIRAINAEVAYNKKVCDLSGGQAVSNVESGRVWTVVLFTLCLLIGGLGSILIVRDLNRRLNRAVSGLTDAAHQIAGAAGQIADSSQSLAKDATEQASSLEETSASTEEISSMTRQNAQNSVHAAEFMGEVAARVADANRSLELMVASMQEIGSSSDKISKIIRVIDEIAFQTNILALNAAVEAARAGQAGQGFAVVANEVRSLAQRCADAAKETAGLIEASMRSSQRGHSTVEEFTAVVQAVTQSAAKAKDLVEQVNCGNQEQAQGIEQIARTVTQMEQVTQTTAASASAPVPARN